MNALEQGYRRCAELTRRHGTTYYWGALLLSADQRRDVFAVYALCRLADDIVDEPETVQPADTAIKMNAIAYLRQCTRPCSASKRRISGRAR